MLKKFLKEIMIAVAGKQAEGIVDLLDGKKYVNEFLIAKKLDITINQMRNILYKISDCGLVSFIRKKDKRKGWYTYFWKIEILKSLEFFKRILVKRIEQINHQIKSRETKQFYVCERCNIEFNDENALLHNFTCDECGAILTIKDNTKVLKEFKKNLDKLKKELALVDEEIKKEKEKLEKRKIKELKKQRATKKPKVSRLSKSSQRSKQGKKLTKAKKKPVEKKTAKKKTTKRKPTKKKTVRKNKKGK